MNNIFVYFFQDRTKPLHDDENDIFHLCGGCINMILSLIMRHTVDWYPWGEEAFEKAKRENKLIFLSIGYSTW